MESREDAVIAKIKALLALAEDTGATPEEAANAAAKANRLLLKYNLDRAKIEVERREKKTEYISYPVNLAVNKGPYVGSHRNLLAILAEQNFCTTVYLLRSNAAYLIGDKTNCEAVYAMYNRLQLELAMMADAAWEEFTTVCLQEYNWEPPTPAVQWKRNFLFGASVSIYLRLVAERREFEQEAQQAGEGGAVTALVAVNTEELERAQAKFFPRTKKGAKPRVTNRLGWDEGMYAGKSVSLHRHKAIVEAEQ